MSECTDTGCYNYSTGECQAPSPLTGLIGGTRGCTAHSSVAGWATCSDTPPHSSLAIYEQEEVIRCSSIPNILTRSSCRFCIPRRGTSASCSVWSPAGTPTGAQPTPWLTGMTSPATAWRRWTQASPSSTPSSAAVNLMRCVCTPCFVLVPVLVLVSKVNCYIS